MSLESVRPTTMNGIKRLASQLGKRDGIRHTAALEAAARQGRVSLGFHSFLSHPVVSGKRTQLKKFRHGLERDIASTYMTRAE